MSSRDYYTHDEQQAAQNVNIADFLQSHGYELIRHGNCFKSKLHDSLNIRDDGRWFWNSRDLDGYLPVELYKQILIHDFGYGEKEAYIEATKQLGEADIESA